ncbi:Anaphase-promoting complex subunit 15 [Neolecta irregularis DAH-3]|uniref:Anaphase-promoting complex subunit 15 n=1 Tax=Neolecta irregularis (strain DAH-3) TaxID=1198029 RepID=A0A1U7LU43_NEOID|nr:Anaphase-promoting complex subunit 15 [Neolecta irregularis DAH-3]|eukprot:OLL26062.1 Anaphase-promoting complex subunit 15 [Neolecta irregularis DAH-3]
MINYGFPLPHDLFYTPSPSVYSRECLESEEHEYEKKREAIRSYGSFWLRPIGLKRPAAQEEDREDADSIRGADEGRELAEQTAEFEEGSVEDLDAEIEDADEDEVDEDIDLDADIEDGSMGEVSSEAEDDF